MGTVVSAKVEPTIFDSINQLAKYEHKSVSRLVKDALFCYSKEQFDKADAVLQVTASMPGKFNDRKARIYLQLMRDFK